MQHHPIGTAIDYAGDIANPSGFGKIVRLDQNPRFGATSDIELEDGCELRGIPTILLGNEYHGHHGNRFVTRAAYDAYWKERADPQTPTWFHGIEHLTIDDAGYLSWKGQHIEHFDPEFAQTNAAKGKARILAARCRHLEAIGKDVNKFNVVLNWQDRVQEPVGAGRGR
jgi:hypothetical protein